MQSNGKNITLTSWPQQYQYGRLFIDANLRSLINSGEMIIPVYWKQYEN